MQQAEEMQQAPDHEREESSRSRRLTQRQLAQFYRQALRQQAQSLDCPPPPVPALRSAPPLGQQQASPDSQPLVPAPLVPAPLVPAPPRAQLRRSVTPEWTARFGFVFPGQNPASDDALPNQDEDDARVVRRRTQRQASVPRAPTPPQWFHKRPRT